MLKLVELGGFGWDEPDVKIVNNKDIGHLTKSASHEEINSFIATLKPDSDKVYVHILALGALPSWGFNKNADGFPRENLKKYHHTFVESAHIYRNHQNKNPDIAIGKVIHSVFNDRMDRVELIAYIRKDRGADIIERLENGDYPPTSMAVRTPYDTCSICGAKASTRAMYCSHLSDELGRIYPDGKKVGAINDGPLKFIDQSIVLRPADSTSSILQKVASADTSIIGSAELAEIEGLTEKTAAHKKLSEFIKHITDGGYVVDHSESLDNILAKVKDPELAVIPHLAKHELSEVLATLAHLGITPSLKFLAELIGHKISGPNSEGIGELVEGYIGAEGIDKLILSDKSFASTEPNPFIMDLLMPSVKQASLFPEQVAQRSLIPGTNVGYAGSGPAIEETPVERFRRLSGDVAAHKPGGLMHMIKSLIVIGGAALAAKWYINNLIEQKMREQENSMQSYNNHAKIVIVKQASDYKSTYHLATASFVKSLTPI